MAKMIDVRLVFILCHVEKVTGCHSHDYVTLWMTVLAGSGSHLSLKKQGTCELPVERDMCQGTTDDLL